ncbi:MAG TPA: DUF3344 domain-containing protein [Methanomicrobiales archaeon]|jgi:hypothetical protein|nr:DUF3344 domain-containing protein [Methanomicrobiales archaeon]
MIPSRTFPFLFLLLFLPAAGMILPVAGLYDFEGIPLSIIATGMVKGSLLVNGTYGLQDPPMILDVSLPAAPTLARAYVGVWGGTENYRGWSDLTVNGQWRNRNTLYGKDDRNSNVDVAGHGVYWIAYDVTSQVRPGRNLLVANSSRGEPNNRLDGRIYAVMLLAVLPDAAGSPVQYWISEGNENLHGEGWAGANPTRHDRTEITFLHGRPGGGSNPALAVMLIAGTRGQPDYVTFNGQDLGVPPANPSEYPPGARDIGDERSFNAMGGQGIEGRYTDAETFGLGSIFSDTNTLVFERGRDQDGDGTITTTGTRPEGEDYIHPVLAVLTVDRPGSPMAPDLAVENLSVADAYAGETARISCEVRNYGAALSAPAELIFTVDGETLGTEKVLPDKYGRATASVSWRSAGGRHAIEARVSAAGTAAGTGAERSLSLTVGTLPDLSVSAGAPLRAGSEATPTTQKSPAGLLAPAAGILAAASLFLIRRPPLRPLALLFIICLLPLAMVMAASADIAGDYLPYTLPVVIGNRGGSDAPPFAVTVYLDGEKAAVHRFTEGLPAGGSASIAIPVFTTRGSHRTRVVVDEAGLVRDADRGNNALERTDDFP